jgi:adenylate kinase
VRREEEREQIKQREMRKNITRNQADLQRSLLRHGCRQEKRVIIQGTMMSQPVKVFEQSQLLFRPRLFL